MKRLHLNKISCQFKQIIIVLKKRKEKNRKIEAKIEKYHYLKRTRPSNQFFCLFYGHYWNRKAPTSFFWWPLPAKTRSKGAKKKKSSI